MGTYGRTFYFAFVALAFALSAHASELKTNAVWMPDAPAWVTSARIDSIVDKIQAVLEWDIRRIKVTWYTDEDEFEKMHGLGQTVQAYSKKVDNAVYVGPKVNDANFDGVFGHELVHVISFQKYKEAIPKWLEEGLANYLAKKGAVDYAWLATQPFPDDVRNFAHPFGGSVEKIRYSYMGAQALTEMIAAHCDLSQLLQLSVGKKMETYLSTFCGIDDINAEFKKWITSHGKKS